MKVNMRIPCSICEGEVDLPVCEAVSCTGERYTQHRRYAYCLGNGEQDGWINLLEFAKSIEEWRFIFVEYQILRIQSVPCYRRCCPLRPAAEIQRLHPH